MHLKKKEKEEGWIVQWCFCFFACETRDGATVGLGGAMAPPIFF